MKPDWSPLDAEIARWRDAGLTLPFWQRDDDAVAPSAALDRLLAARRGSLALAVIPQPATEALARRLEHEDVTVLVHGWRHANHAPTGEKKSEFGAARDLSIRLADARQGLQRLQALFARHVRPVFVPPWNRMDDAMLPGLGGIGYRAVSTYGQEKPATGGLRRLNTHIDPVDWRGGRGLVAPTTLIAQMTSLLQDRRRAGAHRPIGLLTHHLMQDEATWSFCGALLTRLEKMTTHEIL